MQTGYTITVLCSVTIWDCYLVGILETLPTKILSSGIGVPRFQDLIPANMKWNSCNNNRNKVHNKCKALELSWNHIPYPGLWKYCLSWKWFLTPKGWDHWSSRNQIEFIASGVHNSAQCKFMNFPLGLSLLFWNLSSDPSREFLCLVITKILLTFQWCRQLHLW